MAEKREPAGLDEFERQLKAISPQGARLDRAATMFRAGQESVRQSERRVRHAAWTFAATTLILACATCGTTWRLYRIDQINVVNRHSDSLRESSNQDVHSIQASSGQSDIRRDDSRHEYPPQENPNQKMRQETESNPSTPRQDYLHQRRLAMTMGLDALTEPQPSGSSRNSDTRSYRDLLDSILDLDSPSQRDSKKNSERTSGARGDRI